MMFRLFSIFSKKQIIISQSNTKLVFENSSMRIIRQLIIFVLLFFLALDLVYIFAGNWSMAGTSALSIPTLILLAFSNLKGNINISQNEIESQYEYFLFNKNKKISLYAFPYVMVREILDLSSSNNKNPTAFFAICFTQQSGIFNDKIDVCLHNLHLYERELRNIAKIMVALQPVIKREFTFYEYGDIAIDADIKKLKEYYQEIQYHF